MLVTACLEPIMGNSVSRPTISVFTTGGTNGSRLDPVTGGISALATVVKPVAAPISSGWV